MKNGIYLVATPIGNVQDISLRALEVLKSAQIIACEDTRVAKKLFSLLSIPSAEKTFIVMHDHNESTKATEIVDQALAGKIIAYVSDAGSPLISDPGYKLVNLCKERGVYFTTIPGACAVICALQLSGFPSNSFLFAGFIPNKDKARTEFLQKYQMTDATLIFYETANRLIKTLLVAAQIFGNRKIAVVREISKLYEESRSGTAQELIDYYTANPPKGEIVLLVHQPTEKEDFDYSQELSAKLKTQSLKTAVRDIALKYNLSKNEVYQKALELKNDI